MIIINTNKLVSLLLVMLMFISAIMPVGIVSAAEKTQIFLIGDSIVENYGKDYYPQVGWGMLFAKRIDDTKAVVKNYAVGGTSTLTYLDHPNWKIITSELKPNDYVLIELGHNDASSDKSKHTDAQTTYKANLLTFIKGIKEKGGVPILVTPPSPLDFSGGIANNGLLEYASAMKEVAAANDVAVIDLNVKANESYNKLGSTECKNQLFMTNLVETGYLTSEQLAKHPNDWVNGKKASGDGTHYKATGAKLLTDIIVNIIIEKNLPIKSLLNSTPLPQSISMDYLYPASTTAKAANAVAADSPTAVAAKGTPIIDGKIDEIWNTAKSYTVEKWKRKTSGVIKGQFRALWDEGHLFILTEVTDPVLSFINPSPWEQDSVEVFVDENNTKSVSYELGAYQFRVSGNGEKSGQFRPASEINSIAQVTTKGYLVEIAIPFLDIKGTSGKVLGFDVQINDDPGTGKRSGYIGWYDTSGSIASNGSLMANLMLDGGDLPTSSSTNTDNNNITPTADSQSPNSAITKNPFGLTIKINGEYQKATENAIIQNGRTLVPLRGIFEALGAKVTWVEATQMVVVLRGKDSIVFKINSNQAKVNNISKPLEQPAVIINDMAMIPVRFASEAFGITVNWDESTQTVALEIPKPAETTIPTSTADPQKTKIVDVEEPPHDDVIELADSSVTTVYPGESNEILKNPYRGFHVTAGNDGINASSYSSELAKRLSVGYVRVDWSKIEPREGVYSWKTIDDTLDYVKSIDAQIGIGIMPANYNSPTNYGQSTPLWVFDAGAKYTTEANDALKVPVWDDPIYMQKYADMIKALKERYDGNPNVAYFDIRNYGNWGEWHLSGLPNSRNISMENMKKHVDMWAGFKTRVLMMNNTGGEKINTITQYAVDTLNAGIRRDGTTHPDHPIEHLSMSVGYNLVPACGEWWGKYSGLVNSGKWDPVLYEDVIKDGKPTWLGISIHDEQQFFDQCRDLIDRWVNRCGYWFKPVKFSFSNNLGNGEQGKIQFRMKNDGVAPIYANNQNETFVKVALMDSKNKVLETVTLDGINAFNWKPHLYKNEEAKFQFKKNPNGVKLAFGIFTDKNLTNPDVKMGTTAKQSYNWYILNDIQKEQNIDLANNKIYTASKESITKDYGHHEACYAFDGNNERFWGVDGDVKDQWLMVDFGTQTEFSKVELKEYSPKITSFKIQYLNDDKWEDAFEGKSIAKEGQAFSFDKKKSNKVRILILGANGGADLTSFKIMK